MQPMLDFCLKCSNQHLSSLPILEMMQMTYFWLHDGDSMVATQQWKKMKDPTQLVVKEAPQVSRNMLKCVQTGKAQT